MRIRTPADFLIEQRKAGGLAVVLKSQLMDAYPAMVCVTNGSPEDERSA